MTNTKELKIEMLKYGDTGQILAAAIDTTGPTFSNKLNNNAEFTQGEIYTIKHRYSLPAERIDEIFFASEVPN